MITNQIRRWMVLGLLLGSVGSEAQAQDNAITTFYVVRHAEKAGIAGDPPLSEEGVRRAVELYDVLRDVQISAVYCTDTNRTKQTAAPIARACRLAPRTYPPNGMSINAWAAEVIHRHSGENVLVVGHANTVHLIVQALSGKPTPPLGDEYDNLFVVTLLRSSDQTVSRVERAWYGPLTLLRSPAVDHTEHEVLEGRDISAVVEAGDFLVMGSDEKDSIQAFIKLEEGRKYKALRRHSLSNEDELDIEGIARNGNTYFVAGSHARKRTNLEPRRAETLNRTYEKNRQALRHDEIKAAKDRTYIYRFTFDPSVNQPPSGIDSIRLRDVFERDDILKTFVALPGKENGIDIEGVALDGDWACLGFRGPVFRSGYVPVMRLKFEQPENHELRFLHLGGRGIRDITKVQNGFLVIAGPVGDSSQSCQLYHWDGRDCIPGRERGEAQGKTTLLGTIPTPCGAAAEGIAVLKEAGSHYEVLIVYDGAANGAPAVYQVHRPAS